MNIGKKLHDLSQSKDPVLVARIRKLQDRRRALLQRRRERRIEQLPQRQLSFRKKLEAINNYVTFDTEYFIYGEYVEFHEASVCVVRRNKINKVYRFIFDEREKPGVSKTNEFHNTIIFKNSSLEFMKHILKMIMKDQVVMVFNQMIESKYLTDNNIPIKELIDIEDGFEYSIRLPNQKFPVINTPSLATLLKRFDIPFKKKRLHNSANDVFYLHKIVKSFRARGNWIQTSKGSWQLT
jgi:hypothetical protein